MQKAPPIETRVEDRVLRVLGTIDTSVVVEINSAKDTHFLGEPRHLKPWGGAKKSWYVWKSLKSIPAVS